MKIGFSSIAAVVLFLAFLSSDSFSQTPDEGLFVVAHNYKWGYMSRDGKVMIDPQFDYSDPFREGLGLVALDITLGITGTNGDNDIKFPEVHESLGEILRFGFSKQGSSWGFINRKGEFTSLPQFEKNWTELRGHYPHSNGIQISGGRKYGFVDRSGTVVIPIKFDEASHFSEGLARVNQNGKFGYIDKTGEFAIRPKYTAAANFAGGLAAVMINGRWGFINKTGRIVIRPQFENVHGGMYSGRVAVQKYKRWGLINDKGRLVANFEFDDIDWMEGYYEDELVAAESFGKKGYIDRKGKVVIAFKFEWACPFREGLACVEIDQKYGFIDKTGKIVIPYKYDEVSSFKEGLARVKIDGKVGFIDKEGNEIIKPEYDDAEDFSEGVAAVAFGKGISSRIAGKKWGFIDKTGKIVIPLQFDRVGDFRHGLAYIELGTRQCEMNIRQELVLCDAGDR